MMLKQLIDRLAAIVHERGRSLQAPASAAALDALDAAMREQFGVPLADDHRACLSLADGIDYDGLQVFATRTAPFASRPDRRITGLLEANDAYGEFEKDAVIVANDNGPMVWLARKDGSIHIVSPTGGEGDKYPSFTDALVGELGKRLAKQG